MIWPIFGFYKVQKYLFIGIIVKNKNIIYTDTNIAVTYLRVNVYTIQYPTNEHIITIVDIIIFLSVGNNLFYRNAPIILYDVLHYSYVLPLLSYTIKFDYTYPSSINIIFDVYPLFYYLFSLFYLDILFLGIYYNDYIFICFAILDFNLFIFYILYFLFCDFLLYAYTEPSNKN